MRIKSDIFSKLFGRLRRKPKVKEPSLWADESDPEPQVVNPDYKIGMKLSLVNTLVSLRRKTVGRFHPPNIKLNPRLIKAKMILAGSLGLIYFLSGTLTLPNPFAVLPLISAYFLADYVWVLRKLKWFRSGIFKEE